MGLGANCVKGWCLLGLSSTLKSVLNGFCSALLLYTTEQRMLRFQDKSLALAITGSIAAYKSLDLIRLLQKQGMTRIYPMLTPSAARFVTPLSLEMLAGQPVQQHELALDAHHQPAHITLAQQADALLIHPASANTLAKLAHGLADNIVTTTALTFTGKPVIIAPAMNTRMWHHPATQANIALLRQWPNITVLDPANGLLACGETGAGHLPEPEEVLDALYRAMHPHAGQLAGQTAVVTAGGTIAPIDAVRHLTNRSTGKMGIALADELWAMGAEVSLVAACPVGVKPYPVFEAPTVPAMLSRLMALVPHCTQLWMAAALSDFRLEGPTVGKLKRQPHGLTLPLAAEVDVLQTLAAQKQPSQRFIGFAAESSANVAEAVRKCQQKHLDAIVLNDISRSDIGFASDENETYLVYADGSHTFLPKQTKRAIAQQLIMLVNKDNDPVSDRVVDLSVVLPLNQAMVEL
jgi:phosphopantothenoylcysteine decarboxylase / phosphopantothenate---cysteine ligase